MILCSGCFDGLHEGHVRYLKAAAKLGPNVAFPNKVTVIIASDKEIEQCKGKPPRWSAGARQCVVQALRCVESAVCGDLVDIIGKWKPELFVKGRDWEGRLPPDVVAALHEARTTVCFVDTEGEHHNSQS